MAKKENVLNTYRDQALERISTDTAEYHKFLEYCGRGNIHKLSFNSQLALFWQKPFATIIAGFDAWNRGAGNRILSGSHGAGIYEEPGMSFKGNLERNVFDITETDNRNPVLLWQLKADDREGLATYLAGTSDLVYTIQTAVYQYLNGMLNLNEGMDIKGQIQNAAIPYGLSKEDVTNFISDSILEIVSKRMGFDGEDAFTGDYSRIFTVIDNKKERKGFLASFAMYASHAAKAVTLFFRDQIYQLDKEKNTERKQTDGDKGNDDGRGIFYGPAERAYGGGDQAETLPGEETVRPDAVYLPFGAAGAFVSVTDPDGGDAPGAGEDRGEGQGDVKPGDHGIPETPQEPYRGPVRGGEAHREGQGDVLRAGHQRDGGSPPELILGGEDNFSAPGLTAEPTVTILRSEHGRFHDGEIMSLSEADAVFGRLDKAAVSEDGYYKTEFRIDFVMDGQPDNYTGRQDLGDGDGTLIDHIESYHAYYGNNADWDNYLLRNEGMGALEADKAQREMLLHEFVPYLKLHNNLSQMERAATEALQESGRMTPEETAYHTAMKAYASECRAMVNSGKYDLPPVPQLKDFDRELAAYKEHVKEEIAQEAAAAGMSVEEYAANGYEPYAALEPEAAQTAETPEPEKADPPTQEEGLLSGKDTGKEEIPPRDFYFDIIQEKEEKKAAEYGSKTGFSYNAEAIRLLKKLKEEDRNADLEEQRILSRYMGWGGLPQAFDENNAAWEKEYRELKSLLSKEEYEKARASTLTAFYTDEKIIKVMWEKLMEMGFAGGNVLEPAMGTGKFYSAMPAGLRDSVVKYGVELDPISAGIAEKLHPNAHIETGGFETNSFGENLFDLVIGNVPFGDFKVYDQKHKKEDFTIHNYFFVKALDAVRSGGIVAFITSTGTMDALDGRAREYLAARADLLGAVRLPDNAFSTTSTASDIIFLKKRGDIRYDLPDWTISKKEMVDTQTGKAISHFEQYAPLLTVFTEHTYETVLERAFEKEKEDAIRFAVEEYLTYTPKAEVMDVLSQHFRQGYAWISSRLVDFIEYDKEKALGHLSNLMEGEGSYQEIYDLAEQYGETKKGTELNVFARRLKNSSGHAYHTYQEFFETLAASPYEDLKKAVHNEILSMALKRDPALSGKDAAAAEGMEEMTLNQYFAAHPEMILGKMRYMPGKFGEDSRYTTCVNDEEGFVIEDALRAACKGVRGEYQSAAGQETEKGDKTGTIPAPAEQKNFTYMVSEEGKLYYKNNSVLIPYQADKPKNISRIKKLVQLKETEKELLNIQLEGCTDREFEEKCLELNALYDDFVKTEKYHVGDNFIAQIMSDDVEYPLLCALEDRDEEGNISKADIFRKRTIHPRESFDRIETPVDALNVSINKLNCVDLAFMGRLLGESDLKKITDELKGMIYLNPAKYLENDYTAGWETAEEYLSGNVRGKLRVVGLYMDKAPELFAGNKEALEKNLPEWLDASRIEVHLGTPWIGDEVYRQFIVELLKPRPYLEQMTSVERFSGNNSYKVSGASDYSFLSSATESYGTSRMNGAQIIENLLNLRTIEIKDKVYDAIKEKDVYVVNAQETAAAQAKADLIKEKFKEWFWQDIGRRETYEAYYNNTFNNVKLREYDGSMLTFDGISSQIELRPHQKDAVARAVRGRNTLLAHCVGAGKTFEMECACMELRRLGLANKPLMVVPNHLTSQTASEFMRLYPSANLLLTHKKDFEKKNRKVFISKIATGDYDCVIMGFSQFEKISMSPEYEKHMLERQKQEMLESIRTMEQDRNKNYTVKQIEKNLRSTEERIKKLMDAPVRDDMIYFENLGIDCLIVDEAHEYKNLGITTKMERVAGVPQQSAQKAFDLYMKKGYIEEGGGKIIFATGTPVSNTMAEMYVMMKYLYEREMEQMGITCFDAWAAIFGEVVPMFELKVAGDGYQTANRFARFVNVPELMSMYKSFADIVFPDMIDLDVPGLKDGKYTIVESLPDEAVKEKMEEFAARADKIHNGMVSPKEDNMLNITNEARLLGTDIRLLDAKEEGYEGSKLNLAVENICRIYKEFDGERGTQIVFSDIGTPTGRHPFNVYDYIRDGCIKNGIPAEEIAYIHDADTEKKKDELFAAMRNGTVRLLIGSTTKMGTGMNVQKRVCALHEIDIPWRPADVEQREGRAIRQGNMFGEVEIFRYVTKQTFDAYSYQMLERKQGFISQVMGRDPAGNRTCEDIDNKAMSYAQIKSLASGNPLIEEKFKVDAEVSRLKLLKQQYVSNKYRIETEVKRHIPEEIRKLEERIGNVTEDIKTKNAMMDGGMISVTIGKETYRLMDLANTDEIYRKQRKRAGEAILAYAALADGEDQRRVEFGEIGDFKLSVDSDIYGNEKSLVISGRAAYAYQIGKDAYGNAAKLRKGFDAIGSDLGILTERAERYKANLETLKQEIEKPFEKEEELASLIKRQTELNVKLSKDKRDETKEQEEGRETSRHTVQR